MTEGPDSAAKRGSDTPGNGPGRSPAGVPATPSGVPPLEKAARSSRRLRRVRRAAVCLAVAAGAVLAAVLYAFDPTRIRLLPPCLFNTVTGLHCPGCGATRAVHSLLHGDIGSALALNPLFVLALPFLALLAIREGLRLTGRCRRVGRNGPVGEILLRVLPAILIAYWVLRNIPLYPFTLLAPH